MSYDDDRKRVCPNCCRFLDYSDYILTGCCPWCRKRLS